MSESQVQELVGTRQAALFLGVSEATVRKLTIHGFLPYIQVNGRGDYRYSVEDLHKMKDLLDSGWKPSYKN